MPFMKGQSAIRNTRKYLEAGKLILKNDVRIMSVNYNTGHKPSTGAYDFVFWHWGQLHYNNPEVQFLVFKNLTPTPFMKVYYDNGSTNISQLDCQPKDSIFQHVMEAYCKTKLELEAEAAARQRQINAANFGEDSFHHCMCELPGQMPCTLWVIPPKELRGKHTQYGKDVVDES